MKTVLVTGANRGLGLGFCQQYFAQGDLVIAVCRPNACQKALLALKALDDKRIRILCADLHSQASISQLAANVSGSYTLDVLINNAGVSANEPFGQWTQEAFVDNFMVNSIAPSLLCQALIDSLASRAKVMGLLTMPLSMVRMIKSYAVLLAGTSHCQNFLLILASCFKKVCWLLPSPLQMGSVIKVWLR